jgi:hypothetical protein
MQHQLPILFGKIPKQHTDWGKYLAVEIIQFIAKR